MRPAGAFAGALVVDQADADGHGAAFDGVPGQRVAEVAVLGRVGAAEGERGRPAALAGFVVAVEPAHGQAGAADRVRAEQVAVGQRPAGLAGCDLVVVLPGDDQVAGVGAGAVAQAGGAAGCELAPVEQVALDAAGQVVALGVPERGEDHVGAGQVLGEVGAASLLGHLFVTAAVQPGVRVVVGQRGHVPGPDGQ